MADHVVLDTSVVLKWFRQGETLAEEALALRTAYLEGTIRVSVPTLLAYEMANALRYKQDLATAQVEEAVQSLFDMKLTWVPPLDSLVRRAVTLAREYDITVCDATFAALAQATEASLVTADERLAHRLQALACVRFLGALAEECSASR